MSVRFSPAKSWMVKALYGKTLPTTVYATVGFEGTRVLGMCGFYPQDGRWMLFAKFTDEGRERLKQLPYTRAFLREARRALAEKAKLMPVRVFCDRRFEGAERLLEHLGFTRTNDKDFWEWATSSKQ